MVDTRQDAADPFPEMRWQYTVVNIGTHFAADRLGMALSHFGSRGWELIGIYDKSSNWLESFEKGFMLFKRPVRAGDEPDGPWAEVWDSSALKREYARSKGSS